MPAPNAANGFAAAGAGAGLAGAAHGFGAAAEFGPELMGVRHYATIVSLSAHQLNWKVQVLVLQVLPKGWMKQLQLALELHSSSVLELFHTCATTG